MEESAVPKLAISPVHDIISNSLEVAVSISFNALNSVGVRKLNPSWVWILRKFHIKPDCAPKNSAGINAHLIC